MNINKKVLTILNEYSSLNNEEINVEMALESIGIDSLALVEIIFDIEETFDVSVPDEAELAAKAISLQTVNDVINLVDLLIKENKAHES
jgi:acyl carrier protein